MAHRKLGIKNPWHTRVRRPQRPCSSDFESLRWISNVSTAEMPTLDQPRHLDRLLLQPRRGRRTGSRASDVAAKGLLCCAGRTETKISQRLAREPLVWRRRSESLEAAPAAAATARGGSIQPPHERQARRSRHSGRVTLSHTPRRRPTQRTTAHRLPSPRRKLRG